MATTQRIGDASLLYTPPGESEIEHLLAIPLAELQPIEVGSRYEWWSEDRTTREVVTVGDGVQDMLATVRMDDEPNGLRTLLNLALRHDLTITYVHTSGEEYDCKVVEIVGAASDEVAIGPDRDRWAFNEWECRLRLRAVGSTTFDGLFGS